MKTAVR